MSLQTFTGFRAGGIVLCPPSTPQTFAAAVQHAKGASKRGARFALATKMMFERFTEKVISDFAACPLWLHQHWCSTTFVTLSHQRASQAIKVVMLAQEEARRLGTSVRSFAYSHLWVHGFVCGWGCARCSVAWQLPCVGHRFGAASVLYMCVDLVSGCCARRPCTSSAHVPYSMCCTTIGTCAVQPVLYNTCPLHPGCNKPQSFVGHNFVGTEQILLGLIGESTGIAAKVLKSMGVTLKDARVEVEKIIGRGSGFVAVEIPFTPRAKRVLELSLEEARQLGMCLLLWAFCMDLSPPSHRPQLHWHRAHPSRPVARGRGRCSTRA